MSRHLLAWLALIGTSGCSFALDGPEPGRPKSYAPKCDDNKGLVAADGLLATALGIGSLSAFGQDAPEGGVVLGLLALAFTASAVRGNGVVNECRAEQARFAQENVPMDPATARRAHAGPVNRAPVPPPRPVVVAAPPTAPSDPYVEPPRAATAPAALPPAPKPVAPTPAPDDIDPEAWRDFWTEVP